MKEFIGKSIFTGIDIGKAVLFIQSSILANQRIWKQSCLTIVMQRLRQWRH